MRTDTQPHQRLRTGRPANRRALLTLPIPPSVNKAWANVAGKGRVRAASYREWRETAGWTIRAARVGKIEGHVAIRIRAGITGRRRDLDNVLKPILDALTAFHVIQDDSLAHRIAAEWSLGVKPGLVEIEVRQFAPPETRQRIVLAVSAHHAARRAAQQQIQVAA